MTIPEILREMIKVRGISATAFARLAGIDPGGFSRVMNGRATPGGKFIRSVARMATRAEMLPLLEAAGYLRPARFGVEAE